MSTQQQFWRLLILVCKYAYVAGLLFVAQGTLLALVVSPFLQDLRFYLLTLAAAIFVGAPCGVAGVLLGKHLTEKS